MPELPEVETAARDLNAAISNRTISDVWLGAPSLVRNVSTKEFSDTLIGSRCTGVSRIGKNIFFCIVPKGKKEEYILAVHPKMTGHFLLGEWAFHDGDWQPLGTNSEFLLWMNRYIRMLFHLDTGQMLAFSDVRKFSRILLGPTASIIAQDSFTSLGPDPLSADFTPETLQCAFQKINRCIKQVLLDQTIISGIGNIYADEALWAARIHPQCRANMLSEQEIKRLCQTIQDILTRSIALKGSSMSTFRHLSGEAGAYGPVREAYKRTGQPCRRCNTPIVRIVVGGRSTHFCPACQMV